MRVLLGYTVNDVRKHFLAFPFKTPPTDCATHPMHAPFRAVDGLLRLFSAMLMAEHSCNEVLPAAAKESHAACLQCEPVGAGVRVRVRVQGNKAVLDAHGAVGRCVTSTDGACCCPTDSPRGLCLGRAREQSSGTTHGVVQGHFLRRALCGKMAVVTHPPSHCVHTQGEHEGSEQFSDMGDQPL